MATLADLRNVCRKQTLVETDDLSNNVLDLYINQGLNRLSVRFPWPWLEASTTITTVADQDDPQAYALPSDYRRSRGIVESGTQRRLQAISLDEYLEKWGNDPPESDPARWFHVFNGYVYLTPVPQTSGDTYVFYYLQRVTTLTADSDTPEFDSEFHLVPTTYAIARLWEREEDYTKAAAMMDQFDREVEEMARYYLKQEEDYPRIFGDGIRPDVHVDNMPWLSGA